METHTLFLPFFYWGGYVTCVTIITSFVAQHPVCVYTGVCEYFGLNKQVCVFHMCKNTRISWIKKIDLQKQIFNNFNSFPQKFSLLAGVVYKQFRAKSNVTGDNFKIISLKLLLAPTLAIAQVTLQLKKSCHIP